ncbi:MAG: histidine kinase [bacterium]
MSRRILWLQLLIGWLPVWGLVTAVVAAVHGASWHAAAVIAFRSVVAAAVLGLPVLRLTERYPWPRPMRVGFVAIHVVLSLGYAFSWLALNSAVESVLHRHLVIARGPGIGPFMVAGVLIYLMVAGVSYTAIATDRAARAEANAARAQLAALRSQLNPHFLFNVLHTVVQLIPREPARAAQAAEQLAGLLRVAMEEDRDLVPLTEEWSFVEKYLDIERIRFGDRLRVRTDMSAEAGGAMIPVFALQTLVENAVRHGASPRVEATDVSITGSAASGVLTLVVHDTGAGATASQLDAAGGTGIRRLRDRLAVLYGARAELSFATTSPGGFTATLAIPHTQEDG